MEKEILHQKLAELAFRYVAARSGTEADLVLADLTDLTRDEPGDYYVVFERLCLYIAEHNSMYVEPPTMAEVLAWLGK
jgi:hypothetical protein